MSKLARDRGASFEREVCHLINARLGLKIGRKLGQARDSGNDFDFGPFVGEAKRRRNLGTVYSWLRQANESVLLLPVADRAGKVPVVIGREDNGTPIAILSLADFLDVVAQLPIDWSDYKEGGKYAV
jgi:hypothetical protein